MNRGQLLIKSVITGDLMMDLIDDLIENKILIHDTKVLAKKFSKDLEKKFGSSLDSIYDENPEDSFNLCLNFSNLIKQVSKLDAADYDKAAEALEKLSAGKELQEI